MDGYAYVLEALRADGCRRLRTYVPDGRTKFSTWLVLVTRRLVLDYCRGRYGRARSTDDARRAEQIARRRLEDLVAEEIDPEHIVDSGAASAEMTLRRRQLTDTLRRAIDELDPTDRLLLALRFVDGRPVREIANALGFATSFHVYRRLNTVFSTLRDTLARRGVSEPEP